MLSHKRLKETLLLHFNFFHKFCVCVCVTSRLIAVVSVFQIKLSKENLCVSRLSSIRKNAIEKEAHRR